MCTYVCMYIAKDPDTTQTMAADSTATNRVCINLGTAEEEDSDDVMDDSDNGQYSYTSHQFIVACCIASKLYTLIIYISG